MSNELLTKSGQGFLVNPTNTKEAMECCEMLAKSSFIPKEFQGKPADILVGINMGVEIGLKPLQSLQNIAVINGKPCIYGDMVVALARSSGVCEYIHDEWDEKTQTATVRVKRKNEPEENVKTFSMEDAKRAGLSGRDTWIKYPKRMCTWRAKSWAIRDQFSDFLKGLSIREEVEEFDTVDEDPKKPLEDLMPKRKVLEAQVVPEESKPEPAPSSPPPPETPEEKKKEEIPASKDPSLKTDETEIKDIAYGKQSSLFKITGANDVVYVTLLKSIAERAKEAKSSKEIMRITYKVYRDGANSIMEFTGTGEVF